MKRLCVTFCEGFTETMDLEERRMGIAQIYACVLLCFLLKAETFDVPF